MRRSLAMIAVALIGLRLQAPAPKLFAPVALQLGRPFRAVASWYGPRFHGRITSSGERFDSHGLTAAHRTLPFGARLLLRLGSKSALVRVNDRGPWGKGRDLDISLGAAEALGFKRAGIASLQVQIVEGE